MDLDDLSAKLANVRILPSGRSARCPAHDDRVSSLMLNTGKDGGIVVKCHAGCATSDVMAALGLTMADLMGAPRHVATYQYLDRSGNVVLYEVQRWVNPKTFRCVPGLPVAAERVLYQLPAIVWARENGALVNNVEGEKDADRLIALGLIATTNVTGAGAWLPQYNEQLAGCHVRVIADNDAPGRAHARAVAAQLAPYAATVSLVVPRYGKDVSELLDAGYTLDDLDPLPEQDDAPSYVASRIRPRRVEWAWQHYIPLAKLSILEGDPGDGKSILTLDLASRWSTGAPMPDGSNGVGPWPVILVSAEDDPEDTILPRLVAAGAHLDSIILVPHGATPEMPFEFATDLSTLERTILATGARMVIFDPVTAFLSERTDSHNDASVRRALQPLKMLAHRTGAGVTAVRHLNKGGGGAKAIYRGGGSIAFTGAARATFLVAPDPDDPESRIFACVKANLSRKPLSLRYTVEVNSQGVPYIAWHGSADLTAQSVLDGPGRDTSWAEEESANKKRVREYEIQFLHDVLADGPMAWQEIAKIGRQEGFSEIGLRRARADMGLIKLTGLAGNRTVVWGRRPEGVTRPTLPLALFAQQNEPLVEGSESRANRASGEAAELSDVDRDVALDDQPLVCGVCEATTNVHKYYQPYWVVRCRDHNPMDYAGE